MEKALQYLALARKARLVEAGEEPVGAVCRAGKAYLVLVAADASEHTWRRAKSFVAGTRQQCLRLPYDKAAMGLAVGRTELAIAAVTDASMALALVQALPAPEKYAEVIAQLEEKSRKLRQRQQEAKAHIRNKKKNG